MIPIDKEICWNLFRKEDNRLKKMHINRKILTRCRSTFFHIHNFSVQKICTTQLLRGFSDTFNETNNSMPFLIETFLIRRVPRLDNKTL